MVAEMILVVSFVIIIMVFWMTVRINEELKQKNMLSAGESERNQKVLGAIQKFLIVQEKQLKIDRESRILLEELKEDVRTYSNTADMIHLTPQQVIELIDDVEVVNNLEGEIEVQEIEK